MTPRMAAAALFLWIWGAALLPLRAAESARIDFARAMGSVETNMQADEVVRLLGRPDDIRTELDPGGISTSRTTEIWCYGTSGHLTFPTLGCVFMEAGGAQYIHGGKGTPIDPAMLDEAELRKLLQRIDELSQSRGNNPLLYIQLVNTLQPLGKDRSLAVIAEYLRVSSYHLGDRNPLFILLRLLFEVPEDPGFMPRMMVGAPSVKEPDDGKLIPLFPVVLMGDIPLNLVIGYSLAGTPQPVEEHLEYFRKSGKWRERPLHPSSQPMEILTKLENSPQWIYDDFRGDVDDISRDMNDQWIRNHLAEQLLRLVGSVYRIETAQDGRMIPRDRFDPQQWDKIVKDVAALDIRWDVAKNIYVFADGSSLPEIKEPIHMRQIWKIPGLGPRANLIFERKNKDHVLLRLERSGPPNIDSLVKVYRTGNGEEQLAKYRILRSEGSVSSQTSQDIFLPTGEGVQAEIIAGGKTIQSPVFTP